MDEDKPRISDDLYDDLGAIAEQVIVNQWMIAAVLVLLVGMIAGLWLDWL